MADGPALKIPVGETDHQIGPAGASVILVEYGDYQCPHCARATGTLRSLMGKFPDRLALVFRHFPLGKMHPLARKAAEAAEAAGGQGKFWPMHEKLFAAGGALQPEKLVQYAGEIGLDVQQFEAEMSSGMYAERVQRDIAGGARSGVNGTPTLFINGIRHGGGTGFDVLSAVVEAAR